MDGYKFVDDLTSDVMFEAYGKDLREVFTNAAIAMFSVICKLDKVKGKETRSVEVGGKGREELLINWLQHLIGLVDTDGLFFSRFEILEIDDFHLKAKVHGEGIRPELGETVVKAVTYYGFRLEKTDKGYLARVSLDI
ncbi:MAG: archease [Candidatus Aenigmarchaeota archaeon]|nr:archease [Candidatus Aenigmarchaeota archaeon]